MKHLKSLNLLLFRFGNPFYCCLYDVPQYGQKRCLSEEIGSLQLAHRFRSWVPQAKQNFALSCIHSESGKVPGCQQRGQNFNPAAISTTSFPLTRASKYSLGTCSARASPFLDLLFSLVDMPRSSFPRLWRWIPAFTATSFCVKPSSIRSRRRYAASDSPD